MPIEWWALTNTAVEAAVAADDLHDPAVARCENPRPPNSTGAVMPSTPSSARPSITDRGMSASRSMAAASICDSAKPRTAADGVVDRRPARRRAARDRGRATSPRNSPRNRALANPVARRPGEEQLLGLLHLLGGQGLVVGLGRGPVGRRASTSHGLLRACRSIVGRKCRVFAHVGQLPVATEAAAIGIPHPSPASKQRMRRRTIMIWVSGFSSADMADEVGEARRRPGTGRNCHSAYRPSSRPRPRTPRRGSARRCWLSRPQPRPSRAPGIISP